MPAELNELGHVVKSAVDFWEPRRGVAIALQELAPHYRPEMLPTVINFYVQHGIYDRNEIVTDYALKAGIALINQQDKVNRSLAMSHWSYMCMFLLKIKAMLAN